MRGAYAGAGAAAISVLTEPTFFDGALDHLAAGARGGRVPLLRKDFIVSEYQLLEARRLGADAVLLIVGALDDRRSARAARRGRPGSGSQRSSRCTTLAELERAVDAGAAIVGVNSRNLRTLTSTAACSTGRARDAAGRDGRRGERHPHAATTSSGLSRRVTHAFLVGERLITQPDPGAALRELRRRKTARA